MKVPNFYLPSEVDAQGRLWELIFVLISTSAVFVASVCYYWFEITCDSSELSLSDTRIQKYLDSYCNNLMYDCLQSCGCLNSWNWNDELIKGCMSHDHVANSYNTDWCISSTLCEENYIECNNTTPTYVRPALNWRFPDDYLSIFPELTVYHNIPDSEHLSMTLTVPPVEYYTTVTDGDLVIVTNNICLQSKVHSRAHTKRYKEEFISEGFSAYETDVVISGSVEALGNSTNGGCLNISTYHTGTSRYIDHGLWQMERDAYHAEVCSYGTMLESISLSLPLSSLYMSILGVAISKLSPSRTPEELGDLSEKAEPQM